MKNLNLSNIKVFIFEKIKKIKILNIGFIILILFCCLLLGLYNNTSTKLKQSESNLIAQSDTIRTYKNKVGDNLYKISVLTLDIKELNKINSSLLMDINKLTKDDKKHLVEINHLNFQIDFLNNSIKLLNNKLINSLYYPDTKLTTYNYELKDSSVFRELEGTIKITSITEPTNVQTELTIDKVYSDLTIGKTLKNDKLELFVTSSNQNLIVTDLKGSIVDLKAYEKLQPKKRFSIGLQIGYGFTIHGLSPYIGIGGSFNLINF